MGDRLLTDDDINALCICEDARKHNCIEFLAPRPKLMVDGRTVTAYQTVYYVHKDCPLHGFTRLNYSEPKGTEAHD